MHIRALVGLLALAVSATVGAQSAPAADWIVTNAKVWTVDSARPRAEAVAILGERIVAVGSRAEVEAWRGPRTQVLDAKGKLLLPGFNDSHVHVLDGGRQLDNVELKDAATPEEFARRIAERAKRTPPGEWILGGDWDEQRWSSPQLPTRELIDAVTPNTPVWVNRYDGHMALANSVAMKLAGVTAKTRDVPGGQIVRDARGNPTGIFKDAAMPLVSKAIPPLTPEQRLRVVKRALAHAASLGVTSMEDMGSELADLAAYADLAERGELTTRIYAALAIAQVDRLAELGLRRAFGSSYLRLGGLKGYADGSLGSSTAYFFEPFNDAPGNRGLLSDEMQPLSKMRDRIRKADAAGLQVCIHAIGDRAISTILDLYAELPGDRDRRLRIEHSQHVAPGDFARYAKLKTIASVQPYHAIDDGRWAEKRIGPERIKTTYAFRKFLNSGVRLALGTDWYVAPLNPMETLYAAVTRATLDGKNPQGWVPEEKLTLAEAIEAYTLGSAYAEFQEREKGSITPGKLADLVLVREDLFAMEPSKLAEAHVDLTMVGGKVVWKRE